MKFVYFILFGLVYSAKKVLIDPLNWAYSHTQAAFFLAEKIGNDPQYECYFIYDQFFNPPWPINCNMIRLPDLDPDDDIVEILEALTLKAENGLSNAYYEGKELHIHSYKILEKSGIMKKLEDIGIDIALCDYTNTACKVAARKLKIPFVMHYWPMCLPGAIAHKVPIMSSYVPVASISKALTNMGFFKRLLNLVGTQVLGFLAELIDYDCLNDNLPEALEGSDWRTNSASRKDTFFMQACLPTFHYSELLPPNIINTGPFVNKKSAPVSKDISSFADKYKGTVLVSFGSISKLANIDTVAQLCRKFPHIGFILSYKEKLNQGIVIPENLLILKWLKQVDILADNRTVAFITHAGWNSVAESMLHAVPMVACGWSIDRDLNSLLIEERGIGVRIPTLEDFSVDLLEEKVSEVLSNKKYKENIQKYSKLLYKMDGPGKILEVLDLYSESGAEKLVIEQLYTMHWVQFYNLDVWLFEVFLVLLFFFLLFKLMKLCFVFLLFKKVQIESQKDIKKD